MKHVVELNQGLFRPEIQGALQRSAAEKFCLEKFHHTSRVNARFVAAFRVAYDSLAASTHETEAASVTEQESSSAGPVAVSAGDGSEDPSHKSAKTDKKTDRSDIQVSAFQAQCENHCREELEARMVSLLIEGVSVIKV